MYSTSHGIASAPLTGKISCGQAESGPRAWIDSPREGGSVTVGSPVSVISHAYAREGVAGAGFSEELIRGAYRQK